jgi:hypothetical protein
MLLAEGPYRTHHSWLLSFHRTPVHPPARRLRTFHNRESTSTRRRCRIRCSEGRCLRQRRRVESCDLYADTPLPLNAFHIKTSELTPEHLFALHTRFTCAMSVFSLDVAQGNPVTTSTVDELCAKLGVSIQEKEKEDYRRLLAIFHDASAQLMAMDGEYVFSLQSKSDTRARGM